LYEAIEIDPYNSGALANSAILYEEKGNFSLAADLIVRALNLAPDKKTLHFNAENIAAKVLKQKQFDKAIKILEILIKVDKKDTNNFFNLGLCYQLTQRPNEAIECFKYVEKQLPDDEQALVSLVKLYGEIGNFDEAILYCEKLLDKHLSTLNAICWRAQFMQAKGNGKEAINFMKSVISNNQMNDHLWITLAEIYSNEGEYRKAISMITKARQILEEKGETNNTEKMDFLKEKMKLYLSLAEKGL
jgi:tetratricopeptide (TPR) repeat protein